MNNDLFRSCRQPDLDAAYRCCLNTCGGARICKALCREIYPGTIPEDCAGIIGCSRPDYVNTLCLEARKPQFQQCCLRRCRAGQWSIVPSIQREFTTTDLVPVDCVQYCNAAKTILLDKKPGPVQPYSD